MLGAVRTSDILLLMSAGFGHAGVISLKSYYGAGARALSHKLRSISAFKGIRAPAGVPGGFVPVIWIFSGRFSYGICIVKGFCEIGGISTPSLIVNCNGFQD